METKDSSLVKELEKLKKLHQDGTLTQKEFNLAKSKLLGLSDTDDVPSNPSPQNTTIKKYLIVFGIILAIIIIFFATKQKEDYPPIFTDQWDSETETPEVSNCSTYQETKLNEIQKDLESEENSSYNDFLNWLNMNSECAIEKYGEDGYKQLLIDVCQTVAWENYNEHWLDYCEINKIKIYTKDGNKTCTIDIDQADEFDRQLQEAKNACILRYK